MKCPTCGNNASRLLHNTAGAYSINKNKFARFDLEVLKAGNVSTLAIDEDSRRPGFDEIVMAAITGVPAAICAYSFVNFANYIVEAPAEPAQWFARGLSAMCFFMAYAWRTRHFDNSRRMFNEATFFPDAVQADNDDVQKIVKTATGGNRNQWVPLGLTEKQIAYFVNNIEVRSWSIQHRHWTPKRRGFSKDDFSILRQHLVDLDIEENNQVTEQGREEIMRWKIATPVE